MHIQIQFPIAPDLTSMKTVVDQADKDHLALVAQAHLEPQALTGRQARRVPRAQPAQLA
jgi:hypothetical protein